MKHALALFFLFIFSFQVLPAKALGKLIAKAQMTEEVKQSCDNDSDDNSGCSDDDSKEGKDGKDEKEKDEATEKYNDVFHHPRPTSEYVTSFAQSAKQLNIWTSEDLIHLFTKDIHCPPPNC